MKAVVAEQPGGPEMLQVKNVPEPEAGPGEVRIRVAYSVLNPLDSHARGAKVAYKASAFPFTPGFEYTGVVDRVGEGVDPTMIGSRATYLGFSGGCAEYAVADINNPYSHLFRIPDDFDWQLAAAACCVTYTGWHVVDTAHVTEDNTVLLHGGAGNVAIMTGQIAAERGARVIGLCSSDDKITFARRFVNGDFINRSERDWVEAVHELTGGQGADLIVDGIAGPDAPLNFEALAPCGQVIYLGAIGGTPPPVDVSAQLYAKSIAVRGFLLYKAMERTAGREHPAIHEALGQGRWTVPIDRVWELEEVADLHRAFEQRQLMGRQLIRVGGDL
jgi:NADPH2:quinone reductase